MRHGMTWLSRVAESWKQVVSTVAAVKRQRRAKAPIPHVSPFRAP